MSNDEPTPDISSGSADAQIATHKPSPADDVAWLNNEGTYAQHNQIAFQVADDDRTVSTNFGSPVIEGLDEDLQQGTRRPPEVNAQTAKLHADIIQNSNERLKLFNNIDVIEKNGRLEYHLRVGGKDTVLFTGEKTVEGVRQAEARIKQMEIDKARELERKYGIQIAGANERIPADGQNAAGQTRQPNLAELAALDAALSKMSPNAPGQMPLKVYFTQEWGQGTLARYKADLNGQPAILVNRSAGLGAMTELDVPTTPNATPNSSLEATLAHELGHHSERQRGRNGLPNLPSPELPSGLATPERPRMAPEINPKTGPRDTEVYKELGFRQVNGFWVMEGKDGNLYQYMPPEGPNQPERWMRVNEQWKPLDASGNPTTMSKADFRTNEQMRQIARITPPSDYFRQPHEVYAEGLQLLRTNAASRTTLLQNSPEVYEIVKRKDQEAINNQYPPGADGQPVMIRHPNGSLVPNNGANRAVVAAFERNNRIQVR